MVSTPLEPGSTLQALQLVSKYTKDWNPLFIALSHGNQERADAVCGGFSLPLACPHQMETFFRGLSLRSYTLCFGRTGHEETV